MHAPTIVSFFMVKRSKIWTNVLNVGPVDTKNNDLYSGGEASTGNKRNKNGAKKVVQESQPSEDNTLGNDAKKRKVPALVMWYLLVTGRLRRIFLNPKQVTLMTWWDDERKVDDDVIAHPADCS
jgi:hypothetical protein